MSNNPKSSTKTRDPGLKGQVKPEDDSSSTGSDDRYRRLLEILPDAVAIHSEGVIVYVNKAAVDLIGAGKTEDLIGKTVIDFVHPEERENIKARIAEMLEKDTQGITLEERFVKLDGSIINVDVTAIQVQYNEKQAIQVIVRNITERKRAEMELKSSEEMYRNLINNAGESILVAQDGMMKFANRKTEEITGYPLKDLLSRPFTDFIYEKDRSLVFDMHQKRLSNKKVPESYKFRIATKDNRIIWVNNHAVIIDWKGKPASLNFLKDINEQVLKEEELVRSENLNRTLVNHIPQRIFIKDLQSNYVIINDSYARDLGIRSEEVTGRNDRDFFPEDYVNKFHSDDKRVMEKGITIDTVEKYIISGRQRWTHVIKVPYRDQDNAIIGVLGIFEDITEKKAAEEALKEIQLRFQKAFETSPDSININRLEDGVYEEVNEGFVKMSGYSREEVIGKSSLELSIWASPGDREKLVKLLKEDGRVENMGAWFRKKTGEKIYGLMSAGVITINNIPHIISITRDITERLKNEENLRLFRSLIDQSSDAIEVIDPETGRFIDVNEKSCKDLGYSREELLNMSIFDIDHGVDPILYSKHMKDAMQKGSMMIEGIHQKKNGSTFPVEINMRYVRLDRDYLVAIVRDISDRKIAEHSMRLQSAALQAAANAIVITDIYGTILWANHAFSLLTGYSEQEAVGRNPRELIKSDFNDPKLYQDMWETITRGDIWHGELKKKKKNGKVYNEEMTITPLKNSNGQIINYIAIKQEITERIKATEEITKINRNLMERIDSRTKALNDSIKELESFTYSLSHDLRAPLRSMNSYASIMMDEYSSEINNEGLRYLSVIHKNALKMGQLLDALLNYTRVGRTNLHKSQLNMKDLVQEIIGETKRTKNIQAEIRIGKLCNAMADHHMMKEVWSNLIDNALKFSLQKPDALIEIGSEIRENEVIYSIRDNGSGFNMNYHHKLFGLFQQLHDESQFGGIGIGLAITKRIIGRHKGRIWADSLPGKGATFYFTLPVEAKIIK